MVLPSAFHSFVRMLELGVALVVFYAMHSLMAWTGVKRWAAQQLGLDRWYRLVYTLVSLALVAWVFLAYMKVPEHRLFPMHNALLRALCWAMVASGALLAAAAILRFGAAGFIGLEQEHDLGLVQGGLHGRIRHPIYAGVVLVAMGWLLLDGRSATLLVVAITFLYLPIGIHLEELKLIARFGKEYERYKREVPALVPRLPD